MSVILSANKLRKSYGSHLAVDQLAFEIERGETFGLLGPNGAGKSTTISMLVGLLQPDEGAIRITSTNGTSGDPVDPACRSQIGVAPQALALYDELTARENLEFFGQLYNLSGAMLRERVDWCLDFAGLADRSGDRVSTYSGGMKRRLNIAAAMIHEPQILLLDEPTVGVDPQSRNHIFESIASLKEKGLTILYTTHYMEEAQRLCDRIAIIDNGSLLALDTLNGLIAAHGGDSVVEADVGEAPPTVELPGVLNGESLRFESATPLEAVAELSAAGVRFQSLSVHQPDLESVFLSLTGRSLRDQ